MKKKYKILVADDDLALLASFRIRLSKEGYDVLCAQDGYQAVALAASEHPDLLILDIHLPAGDGFSVQERVRSMPQLGSIPVICVTGDRSRSVADKARLAGVRWLLRKPFNTVEFLQFVEQVLEQVERKDEPLVVG